MQKALILLLYSLLYKQAFFKIKSFTTLILIVFAKYYSMYKNHNLHVIFSGIQPINFI